MLEDVLSDAFEFQVFFVEFEAFWVILEVRVLLYFLFIVGPFG